MFMKKNGCGQGFSTKVREFDENSEIFCKKTTFTETTVFCIIELAGKIFDIVFYAALGP